MSVTIPIDNNVLIFRDRVEEKKAKLHRDLLLTWCSHLDCRSTMTNLVVSSVVTGNASSFLV